MMQPPTRPRRAAERNHFGCRAEIRKALLIPLALVALLIILLAILSSKSKTNPEIVAETEPAAEQPIPSAAAPAAEEPIMVAPTEPAVSTPIPPARPAVAAIPTSAPNAPPPLTRPEASPFTRQLVANLSHLMTNGPITAEGIEAWKQTLGQLGAQGAAAIPAIWEYLDQNVNVNFPPETANALGHSSLRMAMLGALMSMDSPDALNLGLRTLQSTADPREIAFLAGALDQRAPGEHREMAVEAGRRALQIASSGNLQGLDAGPLFSVLRDYGGANVITDLRQAGDKWRYYSAIALAGLPDGAGIPALLDMAAADPASPNRSSRTVALQMLAQVASTSPEARNIILEQAKAGSIPPATWMNIAAGLGGDVYQIGNLQGVEPVAGEKRWTLAGGQQAYYSRPYHGPWNADDINQRINIIDQLLAVSPNPAAADALQKSRAQLAAKLSGGQ